MKEKKKFYCEECDKEIDEDEYERNDGLCDDCEFDENEDNERIDEEFFF